MSAAPVQADPVEAASQPYGPATPAVTAQETVDLFSSTAAAAADAIASGKGGAVNRQIDHPDSARYAGDY